ncbi:MAG: hypothetical protein Q4A41_01315 [Bacillota bacterium]|nr:hypothetical protein [Bacillota bacterium]
MWFVSIVAGVLSVFVGIIIVKRELNQAIRAASKHHPSSGVQQSDLGELNESFFDIANDLEGKYSVHEKQIQILEERFEEINRKLVMLKRGAAEETMKAPSFPQPENVQPKKEELPYRTGDSGRKSEAKLLLAEGYTISEVAKRLGMGVSELSLMLGMKKY